MLLGLVGWYITLIFYDCIFVCISLFCMYATYPTYLTFLDLFILIILHRVGSFYYVTASILILHPLCLVQIGFTVLCCQTQHQQQMSHPHKMTSNVNISLHHYIYICIIMSQHLSSSAFKVPIYVSVQSVMLPISVS